MSAANLSTEDEWYIQQTILNGWCKNVTATYQLVAMKCHKSTNVSEKPCECVFEVAD